MKVWVTATPENGKANDAVVKLLADRLGVPKSSVRIIGGRRTRNKIVRLEGLTNEVLSCRIGATD